MGNEERWMEIRYKIWCAELTTEAEFIRLCDMLEKRNMTFTQYANLAKIKHGRWYI